MSYIVIAFAGLVLTAYNPWDLATGELNELKHDVEKEI
jgi:hypothetical protein